MYKITNDNFDKFIEKVSDKLGFKIDNSSFDYDILKSLYDSFLSYKKEYNRTLDGIIFENLKDDDLDNFLSFFNIIRKKNNNNELYTIVLKFNDFNNIVTIKEGCIINIGNESFKNIKTVSISNDNEKLTIQKISKREIDKQVIGNNGAIIFSEDNIIFNKNSNGPSIVFLGFVKNNKEQESDFELLERAKSILQSYGYDNNQKIKFELMKDLRIKNVKIKQEENFVDFIVYPKNLDELDNIIKSNRHLVDYYKNSLVELVKPNLYLFNVNGLKEQLDLVPFNTDLIKELSNHLKKYFNSLFVENNKITIKKFNLIIEIKNFFESKSINQINYELIEIEYLFFYKNNYDEELYSKLIDNELIIYDDVISFGSVR